MHLPSPALAALSNMHNNPHSFWLCGWTHDWKRRRTTGGIVWHIYICMRKSKRKSVWVCNSQQVVWPASPWQVRQSSRLILPIQFISEEATWKIPIASDLNAAASPMERAENELWEWTHTITQVAIGLLYGIPLNTGHYIITQLVVPFVLKLIVFSQLAFRLRPLCNITNITIWPEWSGFLHANHLCQMFLYCRVLGSLVTAIKCHAKHFVTWYDGKTVWAAIVKETSL